MTNKQNEEVDKVVAKNKLREFLKDSPLKNRPFAQGERASKKQTLPTKEQTTEK
jgi:hypothetical protein